MADGLQPKVLIAKVERMFGMSSMYRPLYIAVKIGSTYFVVAGTKITKDTASSPPKLLLSGTHISTVDGYITELRAIGDLQGYPAGNAANAERIMNADAGPPDKSDISIGIYTLDVARQVTIGDATSITLTLPETAV